MATALTEFQINGLHGQKRRITIPIRDNKLVLVGENGTGKSTVANLLYYSLTRQWRRIAEYKFETLQVTASGEQLRLTHEDVETLATFHAGPFPPDLRHRYPMSILREASRMLTQDALFEDLNENVVAERIAARMGVSLSAAHRVVADVASVLS